MAFHAEDGIFSDKTKHQWHFGKFWSINTQNGLTRLLGYAPSLSSFSTYFLFLQSEPFLVWRPLNPFDPLLSILVQIHKTLIQRCSSTTLFLPSFSKFHWTNNPLFLFLFLFLSLMGQKPRNQWWFWSKVGSKILV